MPDVPPFPQPPADTASLSFIPAPYDLHRCFLPNLPELDSSLKVALQRGATSPRDGLALAQSAWDEARSRVSPPHSARATLVLGMALNRAERYAEALRMLTNAQEVLSAPEFVPELAVCQWQIGIASRMLRTSADFVDKLEAAVAALLATGLTAEAARCRRELAAAYNWHGDYTRSTQQITEARAFFEAHELMIDAAMCAFPESAVLRWQGKFADALRVLEAAEAVFTKATLPVELATAQLYQGSVYVANMQFDSALEQLQIAQTTFEQLDLPVRLALCRNEIAMTAWKRGHLAEALALYHVNIPILRSLGQLADLALNLFNLAAVHFYQGDLAEASQMYAKAQEEFKRLGDRYHDALCDVNQGVCDAALGRYGSALRQLERGRVEMEALGASDQVALAHHNLGKAWLALGGLAQAKEHLALAIQIYRASQAPFPAARSLIYLAMAEMRGDQPLEALARLQEARQVCEAAQALGGVALCDQVTSEIQLRSEQPAEALLSMTSAERAFRALGMSLNALACGITRAEAHLALGDLEQAETHFQTALAQTEIALPDLAWRCAAGLARIAEGREQMTEALKWYQRAASALEQARHYLRHEVLVDAFLDQRLNTLDRAIRAAIGFGQPGLGLHFVEAHRAQLLATRIGSPQSASSSTILGDSRIGTLRYELTALRHKLTVSLDAHWSAIHSLNTDQQTLLAEIDQKNREYQHLTMLDEQTPERLEALPFHETELRAALKALAPAGWTCLAYYWVGETLLVFEMGADRVEVHRRHLSPIDRTALELCTATQPDHRRVIYATEQQKNPAQARANMVYLRRLHDLLIPAPLQNRLAPEHLLVILPAGRLHALPFHALTNGKSYLCERVTVLYAPSLVGLNACLLRAKARVVPPQSALVVAVENSSEGVPHLPHVSQEAESVRQQFAYATVLQGAQATSQAMREMLQDGASARPDVIHIAAHAVFEAEFGRLSRLLLHQSDLQADEIESLSLAAPLVVLSACQSGLGRVHRGEEIVGLVQAFIVGGASTVVSSFWQVDDATTATFMADFYTGLIQQRRLPAFALAAAQRKWIEPKGALYTWAAFGCFGAP